MRSGHLLLWCLSTRFISILQVENETRVGEKKKKGNLQATVTKVDQHLYVNVCMFFRCRAPTSHNLLKNEEIEVVVFTRLITHLIQNNSTTSFFANLRD